MLIWLLCALVAADTTTTLLSNDVPFPLIGFGTAGKLSSEPIKLALQLGYRLIDTAEATEWYDERAAGLALKEADRSKVFVITKLHPRDLGTRRTERMIRSSLNNLQTDYIDGFLLHYKQCWGDLCAREPEGTWKDSWRVMERFYEAGVLKSIGVSNFHLPDLKQLWKFAKVKPHFIQTWHDPFHQERPLLEYCRSKGIVFQAYSSLGTQWHMSKGRNPIFSSPVLNTIAQETGKSVAQVVLRWQTQQRIAVIPRSTKPKRIQENMQLDFSLTNEQMERIHALDGTASAQQERERAILMNVINKSDYEIKLKWEEQEQGFVPKQEDVQIQTYNGHLWTFLVEGQMLRQFRVWLDDGHKQKFVFTNDDMGKLEL